MHTNLSVEGITLPVGGIPPAHILARVGHAIRVIFCLHKQGTSHVEVFFHTKHAQNTTHLISLIVKTQ
jgi:hypothetical protein